MVKKFGEPEQPKKKAKPKFTYDSMFSPNASSQDDLKSALGNKVYGDNEEPLTNADEIYTRLIGGDFNTPTTDAVDLLKLYATVSMNPTESNIVQWNKALDTLMSDPATARRVLALLAATSVANMRSPRGKNPGKPFDF